MPKKEKIAMTQTVELESYQVDYLDRGRVKNSMKQKRNESRSLNGLLEHAQDDDLSLQEDQVFGIQQEIVAKKPVKPPRERTGNIERVMNNISETSSRGREEERKPVKRLEYTLLEQDISGEEVEGALVASSVSTENQTFNYHALLETEGDDPLVTTTEFTWDQEEVVPAESWWSRFYNCGRGCGCSWTDLLGCWNWSWSGYLWCLVNRCGQCVTKCAACATCNCSWWCSWASGCCRD